jgi:hypothetical protein
MGKEELIKKRIKELEELTGADLSGLERQLVPHPGERIEPLVAKKKRLRE